MTETYTPDTLDPSDSALSRSELPLVPAPCPTCHEQTDALALTDLGIFCSPCFQNARRNGHDPEILDAAIAR